MRTYRWVYEFVYAVPMMKLGIVSLLLVTLVGCAAEPQTSQQNLDPLLEQSLDASWQEFSARYPGIERPDVAVEKVMDAEGYPAQLVDCVHEAGFPEVTLDPDGGIAYEGSQLPAYDLALYTCSARFPVDPKYTQPLDDEQLSKLYDYYTQELVPCIESEGYTAPEAPTRQYFIEHYLEGAWQVYAGVADATQTGSMSEWYRMNEVCPQVDYAIWD